MVLYDKNSTTNFFLAGRILILLDQHEILEHEGLAQFKSNKNNVSIIKNQNNFFSVFSPIKKGEKKLYPPDSVLFGRVI